MMMMMMMMLSLGWVRTLSNCHDGVRSLAHLSRLHGGALVQELGQRARDWRAAVRVHDDGACDDGRQLPLVSAAAAGRRARARARRPHTAINKSRIVS
jgi:hypothetical protein